MGITMQNHGGYDVELKDGYSSVQVEDKYAGYADVVNYLTMIRESDRAYEDLISYLKDYDKPVIVNGGDVFVSEYISRNGNIKDILTGINQETVFSKINFDQEKFEKNDEDTIEYFKKYIAECKSNGLDVYITEYTTDKKLIRQIKDYCKENGFHYYISDSIQLD